ncbi:DNA mismatch repair protein MSH1, mitochondrial-like [Chenopodium quinoa]|uniref:DNA mismatch repair protein MSH1, mitochondrial-like n=1 Tax=Chenopodium quinoa TaxID=63459 RepID=UPI000B79529B|nr:DNA mismatch repair protein MSH1, mitochondrial-like [Chenopodium quinoa]
MYRLTMKAVVSSMPLSLPKWRPVVLLLPFSLHSCSSLRSSSLPIGRQSEGVQYYRDKEALKGTTRKNKKAKEWKDVLSEKDNSHIFWWKEKLGACRKPSTVQLIKRLVYSNLLGLDVNLKNGSLKEGNLNMEMLQFKSRFPREVLLCRVGDFYEAIGIDACVLVEYAGLNPFGGLRTDSVPRAGCPVVNLQQTLDDLTRNGYSVCIVEEVQGPTQSRSRKGRFISGHAHPGSPYVFGHVGVDRDLDFPEPMPVVGVSRSAKGYSLTSVLETLKTFSVEDGLTEEALVTKLRTCHCHYLFLHKSLKHNSSGTCRWGEFGEGGLLWAECSSRYFEWFEGDPVKELLLKVKELYGLEDVVVFRNIAVPSEKRPRPLHLGTATQIGAIPTEGIPCLLKVLLPSSCTGLPQSYVRDLLLNPPAYAVAATIQEICKRMSIVTCSIPEFTCVSSAKLVKLLELREANHIEFCRINNVAEEILQLHDKYELRQILELLMVPTSVATGLNLEFDTLVNDCEWVSRRIGELISLDGEIEQQISSFPHIPSDFFEDIESSWKGRVKRKHMEDFYEKVDEAAKVLDMAVSEDFLPIISRIRASIAPLGGPKGEILYAREHEAVWFKGKRFVPSVWSGTPGEEQIKQLKHALDSKGKKVSEEWFTTTKVEDALMRYHEANEKAKAKVLELLRGLSSELQHKINVLVFASMMLVIAKALFSHVSEGRRRKWVFPTLVEFSSSQNGKLDGESLSMEMTGLSPYWFDIAQGNAVCNTVNMKSLFLLTGPNGGGKSSLLRSVCAAALLGICGFMVPAESASIPHFDAVILHMKSYDSPVDGKSSFQIEMSEMRSLLSATTSRSLVLIDEICRGTETAKGTCIAGSIVETLDAIGCLGIVSTHLHGIFDLPLRRSKSVNKAMSAEFVDGQTIPTWKLVDGICKESLAFETAQREGVPETLVKRAEELYLSVYANEMPLKYDKSDCFGSTAIVNNANEARCDMSTSFSNLNLATQVETLKREVYNAVTAICQKKLAELHKLADSSQIPEINCIFIAAKEQPPPSTIGASSVYVMLRPDKKLYVGETDDLQGRVQAHRLKDGMQNAAFLSFVVQGKSVACQLETLLINQLPKRGFFLTNIADGKHRNFGTCDSILEPVTVCQ